MTIDKIYRNKEISVRSYNVCKYNDIESVQDLQNYYNKHKSFDNLRNCGRKSNEELIIVCNKYFKEIPESQNFVIKEEFHESVISKLTRVQREVINSFIIVNTKGLSVRSKNAISLHLEGNFKIKNFGEKILFSDSFRINDIKNAGVRCFPEIEEYISIINHFLIEVSHNNNEKHLISLKNNFLIQHTFSIKNIPVEILESESIFLLTDFLLIQNAFFDETQTYIFKKAFKLYHNQKELTLDEIANEVELSKERVRQIRNSSLNELYEKLSFIQNFNDDLLQKYDIDNLSDYIDVNNTVIDKINKLSINPLSREFITYILSVYLNETFTLIGNSEDVLLPKFLNARNRHNWNNFYIVKRELNKEIDFIGLTDDISKRINDRITETYSFNFKSYLSKFLINNRIEILELIFPIGENIINGEFDLFLDLDENITFKRNTQKKVPEYIVEALENIGKPSKLAIIYTWINTNYPGITRSEEALRGSCNRCNELIYFGRSSTFGLKKWEETRDDIKGGTIKSIITELLENSNTPVHVTEVLEEIHRYRDKTSEKSIISNLKLDPYNSFIIFNQKFIGLANKKHTYDLKKYENLPLQLGKEIKRKIKKTSVNLDQISVFLKQNYNLTPKETKNILTSLNIDL